MYPHERSLVKRLAAEPFAIIGVNSDEDLEALQPILKKENITWRSFWNGPDGTQGPISARWNVAGWPTVYLIDHQGVIQRKWLGPPPEEELDELVDSLVAKAKGG
jgi:hypothetical protein